MADDNRDRSDSSLGGGKSGADSVTETTSEGWGSQLGSSLRGMLFGILLLPVSVILLYWNEGRAVDSYQALSQGRTDVVEAVPGAALDGKLVHLSGMSSPGLGLSDPSFGVQAKDALRFTRKVQMFQWVEEESTEKSTDLGGTKHKATTYSYRKEWSESPIDSGRFRSPQGHSNPGMTMSTATINNTGASLGGLYLGVPILEKLSDFQPLMLDMSARGPIGYQKSPQGFYGGSGSEQSPNVGDLRISYLSVSALPISVVAAVSGNVLTTYMGRDNYKIALAMPGVSDADQMFGKAKSDESTITWVLRAVGFFAMVFGFSLLGGPVAQFISFIPFLGSLAEGAFVSLAFLLSIPATALVIAVAWIAHRPLLSVGVLALGLGGACAISRLRAGKPLLPKRA